MLSRQQFDAAAFRLADYYLTILKDLDTDFQQGRFQKRAELERNWSQIKQSHQFMSERLAYDAVAAEYCLEFVLTSYDCLYAWRNPNEALLWVETGLRASEVLDNRGKARLLYHQISLHFISRQLDSVQEKIETLLAIAEQSGEPIAKAHAFLHRGRFYLTQGQYDEARSHLLESASIYKALNERTQHGWTLHNLGSIAELQGDLDLAREYLEEALTVYQTPQNLRRITISKSRLGSIIEQQGDQALGFQYADEALKSAYQLQDNMLIISSLLNLAIIVWEGGKQSLSLAYYEEAKLLSRKIGAMPYLGTALMNLGYIHTEQGDFASAERDYAESMATYLDLQYERRANVSQAYLCYAMVMNGNLSTVLAHLCDAWQFGQQVEDKLIRGLTLLAWMAYMIKSGRQSEIMQCYHAIKVHHAKDDVGDAFGIFEAHFAETITQLDPVDEVLSLDELYSHVDANFCE